jgi:hypothetical protein
MNRLDEFEILAQAVGELRERYSRTVRLAPESDREMLANVASHCLALASTEVFRCDRALVTWLRKYEQDAAERTV